MIQLLGAISEGFPSSSGLFIHLSRQLPFLKIRPNSPFAKASPKFPPAKTHNFSFLSECLPLQHSGAHDVTKPIVLYESKEMYNKTVVCRSLSLFPPGFLVDLSQSPLQHIEYFFFPKTSFQDSDFLSKVAGGKPLSFTGIQSFPLLPPSDQPSWSTAMPGDCSTASDTLLFWLIPS